MSVERGLVMERYQFRKRLQKENENLTTYINDLRRLADSCNFQCLMGENLRDHFVYGIRNDEIRNQLLSMRTLDFETAERNALSMEAAKPSVAGTVLTKNTTPRSVTHRSVDLSALSNAVMIAASTGSGGKCIHCSRHHDPEKYCCCYNCKEVGHYANNCPKLKCSYCKNIGHAISKCPKNLAPPVPGPNNRGKPQKMAPRRNVPTNQVTNITIINQQSM